jgi:tetratricopeptide (TPR) repeat protein/O-antigen ligase
LIGLIVRWLPPALLATVPLLQWGEDFRYSRFVLLLAAAAVTAIVRPRKPASRGVWALLAAGPALALASWAADDFSILGLVAVLEIAAAMFAAWALALDRRPTDFAFAWILAISGASVYGIFQALGVFGMPLDAYGQPDPAATFGLSNFAAEALVISIPLTIALFLRSGGEKTRVLLPTAALLQVIYLFLTNARAGWVGMTVAFGVALLLWRPADRRLYNAVAAIAVLFVIGYSIAGWDRLNFFTSQDPSLDFRREAWKAAVSMSADKPLAGHGPGRFPSFVAEYASERLSTLSTAVRRSVHHPHNEFLLVAAERGLPSLLWLLAALGAAGLFLYRRHAVWLLAGLAAATVVALVGFPFQQAFFWAAFPLLIGVAAQREDDSADEEEPAISPAAYPLQVTAAIVMVILAVPFGIRAAASDLSRQGISALEATRRIDDAGQREFLRARAAESLRAAMALWPYDPESILNAATAASSPGLRAELMEHYLAYVPGDMLAHVALAKAQEDAGNPAGAEATLRALFLKKNAPSYAYHRLIEMLVKRNRFEEATRVADEAVLRFKDDVQLLIDAGDAYRLSERYDKAVGFYERALAQKSDEAGLYLRAGISYLAIGSYPQAQEAFQKGRELAPKEPVYLVYLARLAFAAGRKADAKTNLLQALKYDPHLTNNLKGSAPELLPLLQELK